MKRRDFVKISGLTTGALTLSSWEAFESGLLAKPEFNTGAATAGITNLADAPAVQADVRVERGGPRLFLNGDEIYPFMALSTHLYPTIANFREAGIHIYHPIIGMRSAWLGPGKYDWSIIDTFLGTLLEMDPEAYFLPRVQLNTPNWWKEAHPDDMIKYGLPIPKNRKNVHIIKNIPMSEGGHYFLASGDEVWEASFASEAWRRDNAVMLQAFIQHVQESPLRSRVIGYHPTTGRTAEWNYFGPDFLPDYSEPMKRACGEIPDVEARLNTTFGLLRDPAKEKDVINFYRKFHDVITDTILYLTSTIKKAAPKQLCGLFYGYLLEQVRIQEAGYLATKKILESPDIDYIACPYTYQEGNVRNIRGHRVNMIDGGGNLLGSSRGMAGDGGFRMLVESVKRHGKLYISEMDPATYLDKTPHKVLGGLGGDSSHTLEGSLRIIQRDLGQAFAMGLGGWLFDFGPLNKAEKGWYGSPPIIAEIKRLVQLGEHRLRSDISSVAEIAAVYDIKSFFSTAHWKADQPWYDYGIGYTDFFNHWFINSQARTFHRMGAPMDFLHNFDLRPADTQKYRLMFMVNMLHLTAEEVSDLKKMLQNSGITVVWYYAPGFITSERLDLDQMQELTGFRFKILKEPGLMMIRTNIRQPSGRPVRARFGVNAKHHPRFAVIDEEAETLGKWQDIDEVAFAQKEYNGYRSVYVGSAPLPASLLRSLAEQAQVPLWSSGPDIVRATADAAMLVATDKGDRKLILPKPMTSIDGGEMQQEHILNMDYGEVKIFTANV